METLTRTVSRRSTARRPQLTTAFVLTFFTEENKCLRNVRHGSRGDPTRSGLISEAALRHLSAFQKIYVVDLCSALCNVASSKVKEMGWTNVEVIEADAAEFRPPAPATLVTFSYSLSMMPPFIKVIDRALSYLDADGFVGVADFSTSAKYDKPERQHTWLQRWFWRAVFDLDGIDLGPERRQYLEHRLETVYECNSAGKIPYVPVLRAPYYTWIGALK